MFINREEEIKTIEEALKKNKPALILIYGRRRVGKSELLKHIAKKRKSIYTVARKESQTDQLKKISSELSQHYKDSVLKENPFRNYDALIKYLENKKETIMLDEFPYLVESQPSLPSILQEHWDKTLSQKNTKIILCGSSITMMETLAGYKSPLYGRRTQQILLEPLKFLDACKFFKNKTKEEKITIYSILGGTPAYLLEFDTNKTIEKNIEEKILRKNTFLNQDVQFVLQEELKEPRLYYSITKSIAKGNTKLGNIINDTGIEKASITKYLSVLKDLQIIKRTTPLTENPLKSRKGIYKIKDNYFKFWFKYVFENNSYIEQNLSKELLENEIKPNLNQHVSETFEEISQELIKQKHPGYLLGKWWEHNEEIDIIGINKAKQKILACETKWKTITKQEAKKIMEKLQEKSKKIKHNMKETTYIVLAKEIKGKNTLNPEKNQKYYDLNDYNF